MVPSGKRWQTKPGRQVWFPGSWVLVRLLMFVALLLSHVRNGAHGAPYIPFFRRSQA